MAKLSHVAIVPCPGMGHLFPLVELARRLVATHPNFRVTLVVPTIGQPTQPVKSTLESLPITVRHVYLPPVVFPDPPHPGAALSLAVSLSVDTLVDVLKLLSEENILSAVVFDMFSSEAIESVKGSFVNLPCYIFHPPSATVLSFSIYLLELDRVVSGEYRDFPDPIRIPGCFSVHGRDLPDPVQDRKSPRYMSRLGRSERIALADGVIVNSFVGLEGGAIEAIRNREGEGVPPVYPIGPLVNDGSGGRVDGSECLKWLDSQPRGSVFFVSFGSVGTLSGSQLTELAYGLEKSGHKFLWVVRKPNETSANAAYSGDNSENDLLKFLPKGFLERTKEKGLVLPNWAPQAQILSHASIGGFLTHCGWNSTLESIINGQPLIVWPLFAEQKMNAILLSEHLNVGLRPKVNNDGIVPQEEISKVVKALMEGEEGEMIHRNMKLLQNEAKKALSEEGDSTKALADLAFKWSNHTSV